MDLAPNQGSWKPTAETMGVVKTKKRKNPETADPYAGGERSGKKAKPDALRPKLAEITNSPNIPAQPAAGLFDHESRGFSTYRADFHFPFRALRRTTRSWPRCGCALTVR